MRSTLLVMSHPSPELCVDEPDQACTNRWSAGAGVINRAGSFAEYTTVDERLVALKPASLTHEEAAALPLTVRLLPAPPAYAQTLVSLGLWD
jgi:D-arabinose 1-dehydrogenase-like Zn-dependent alcohol dehydrogenase